MWPSAYQVIHLNHIIVQRRMPQGCFRWRLCGLGSSTVTIVKEIFPFRFCTATATVTQRPETSFPVMENTGSGFAYGCGPCGYSYAPYISFATFRVTTYCTLCFEMFRSHICS